LRYGGFLADCNLKQNEGESKILGPHGPYTRRKADRDFRRAAQKHHSAEDNTYLRLAEGTHHLGLSGQALAAGRILGDVLSAESPREAGSHYRQAADTAEELGMRPEVELVAAGLAKIKGCARRMG
jgi:hypothetical protein